MSQSTDGILFYGIMIKGEDGEYEDLDAPYLDNPEEYYTLKVTGVPKPDIDWENATNEEKKPAYDRWELNRQNAKECGCKIDSHCSGDCPMWYIALTDAHFCARRGYPEDMTDKFVVPEKADNIIRTYCAVMGIEYEQPRWWLCSNWN